LPFPRPYYGKIMSSDVSAFAVTGLASNMDTKAIVDKMIAAEKKKIEPIVKRQESKSLELDAWKQVKGYLETVQSTSEVITKKSLWDGKIVTSSNPDVVEAIGTSGAKPGKHTLVVDKLALNHQIASQNFSAKEDSVGRGQVVVKIGDSEEYKITIDQTNDTVQGFVDAIQALDAGLSASIIKTGNKERPFQIVLTSKKTGLDGKLTILVDLKGEGEPPTFDPYYMQPGKWQGIHKDKTAPKPTGTGASTAVPEFIGNYTGEEPLDMKFTVVNTGIVGVSESLRLRWEDNQDRFGYLDMGSFNYTPGEPIAVVDGISLILSDGEVIVNDTFTVKAKQQEPDMFWWKSDEERMAKIEQPSSWGRQLTDGGPIITGKYESNEDDFFTMKVVGSGQIGQADDLRIVYESENGLKGTLFIGKGYNPGTKLSMGKGLELSLKPGLLQDGDYSTFEFQSESTEDYWWLEETERKEGQRISNITNWIREEEEEDEDTGRVKKPTGARISNADKSIVGKYTDFESKAYTFTALKSGSVGTTQDLELRWEDTKGNTGVLNIGEGYIPGTPLEFDSGLGLILQPGSVFETDSFSFRTFSPVIQPPQDAEVRLGATELGGGLLITNPTNTLEDVIEGVKLNLVTSHEKPVTISIRGDTEKALGGIKDFVNAYNAMLMYFQDVTKYDQDSGAAGALQGDRNLPRIQRETSRIFIDPIRGLDTKHNQLVSIGLKISKDGKIELDEEKLTNTINDNLTTVSNLFRSIGTTENSGVTYLSSSEKTQISGEEGYDIDIIQAASRGYYTTKPNLGPIEINDQNKRLYVKINGRESEELELEKGLYTIEQIAKNLQQLIVKDKNIGRLNVTVTSAEGKLTITSNVSGSRSTVSIRSASGTEEQEHFILGGEEVEGKNVQGRIDNVEMEGNGQILTGKKGTRYEGLKLYASLSQSQIGEGAEANMIFTKGVAAKVKDYIDGLMDKEHGALGIYTKNVKEQLKGFEKEVKILDERIQKKREKMSLKFARMEAKLGQLKSEQNYLTNQISKLG